MPTFVKNRAYSFDDVNLLDGYSTIGSRSDVNLTVKLKGNRRLELPILSASMDTITSLGMASVLFRHGAGQVHHRYCSVDERVANCATAAKRHNDYMLKNPDAPYGINGVAIGLTETKEDVERLIIDGLVDLISIDVAACYHSRVFEKIIEIGPVCDYLDIPIMVGNFSDSNFIYELALSDASQYVSLVKVGIGGGSCCTTRLKTGVGKPTFQSIVDAYEEIKRTVSPFLLVADGGIRNSGDIVKAIGAGADLVMLGGMLAAHDECPGSKDMNGKKEFRGMASEAAKNGHFDQAKNIEGVNVSLKERGPLANTLKDLKEGIQSGIATAGFTSVKDFKGQGRFVRVTHAGASEGKPHILEQK